MRVGHHLRLPTVLERAGLHPQKGPEIRETAVGNRSLMQTAVFPLEVFVSVTV